MYCVYVIERDDGLKYVGKTYLEKLKTRMYYHKKSKRFKDHEITCTVLFSSDSHEEVLEKETYYVESLDTFHHGLNKTKDGKAMNTNSYRFTTLGFHMAEETKELIKQKSNL